MIPQDFNKLLFSFKKIFTDRSFEYFIRYMLGLAIIQNGKTAITDIIRLFRMENQFYSFHKFLRQYKWDVNSLSLRLLHLIIHTLHLKTLRLAGDDVLCPKYGSKIFGRRKHHNHSHKPNLALYIFGHNWVTLSVIYRSKLLKKSFSLPFKFKLFVDKNQKSRVQLMIEMLEEIRTHVSIPILLVVDGLYAKKDLMQYCVSHHITLISRLRRDASVYEPLEENNYSGRGRPRKYGKKINLPQLYKEVLQVPDVKLKLYQDRKPKRIQYLGFQGIWRTAGVKVKLLATKYPKQKQCSLFCCTDLNFSNLAMLQLIANRWTIETTFRDLKEFFLFSKWRVRGEQAVNRSVHLSGAAMSVLILWSYLNASAREPMFWDIAPWYVQKHTISLKDMKDQLRWEFLQLNIFSQLPKDTVTYKKIVTFFNQFRLAA
jgi:hypothetical protein